MSKIIIPTFNEKQMEKTLKYLVDHGHDPRFYGPENYKNSANMDGKYVIEQIKRFCDNDVAAPIVTNHINHLLSIEGIDNRIGLIDDGSFCNIRLLIEPNSLSFTSIYELRKNYRIANEMLLELDNSVERIIQFAIQHAERIMVTLLYTTLNERMRVSY